MNIPITSHNVRLPGYGMFWVANSITSTILGKNVRNLQKEAQEHNLEFQMEMERARFITDDERLQEEISFKRRLSALYRNYRQEEARVSFNAQMKIIEFKDYLKYCWPLDSSIPWNILQNLKTEKAPANILNVILMRTPLLPLKAYGADVNERDLSIYKKIEYSIKMYDIPLINDVLYRKDACARPDITGGNASIMNIHFLMSQLPTLVVSPQYRAGKMFFSGAVWEPQAPRPLIRSLFSYDYDPAVAERNEVYLQNMLDLFHACITIIISCTRDSYMMITQGKTPTLHYLLSDKNHDYMRRIVKRETMLLDFIKQENENNLAALDENNQPQLLEVFNRTDLKAIREQIMSIKL